MKKIAVFLCVTIISLAGIAQNPDKRLALVIGNSNYQHGGALKNPVNDANLMAKTLLKLGFEVEKITNADLEQMQNAAVKFTDKISDYSVALFYYAGHGVQVNGVNYLIPVDAQLDNMLRTKYEAFDISDINQAFALNNKQLNIMILDACRNNPFRSWMRGGNTGFSALSNQTAGTIIAFATREGETASDGIGSNGLYTEKLVAQMKKAQNITEVFQNTRVEVLKASRNKQCPQEWNMLTGNFCLVNTKSSKKNNTLSKKQKTGGLIPGEVEEKYGDLIINSTIGGKLYFDNSYMGSIKAFSKGNILKEQTPGKHTIRLVAANGKSFTRSVVVKADKSIVVDFGNQSNAASVSTHKQTDGYSSKLIDGRDGKTYKTVKIGSQIWMAENLAYNAGQETWAYNNDHKNIDKYGYLYTYKVAKNVCPQGWHLPSAQEWKSLTDYVLKFYKQKKHKKVKDELGKYLKSGNLWTQGQAGMDELGFSALPGGYRRSSDNQFFAQDRTGVWWTSSKAKKDRAIRVEINTAHKLGISKHYATYGFSVRCIKD